MLIELRDRSREEAGCIAYDIARDTEDPTVFAMHEIWRDDAALEQHRTEEFFTRLSLDGLRQFATRRVAHRCRLV